MAGAAISGLSGLFGGGTRGPPATPFSDLSAGGLGSFDTSSGGQNDVLSQVLGDWGVQDPTGSLAAQEDLQTIGPTAYGTADQYMQGQQQGQPQPPDQSGTPQTGQRDTGSALAKMSAEPQETQGLFNIGLGGAPQGPGVPSGWAPNRQFAGALTGSGGAPATPGGTSHPGSPEEMQAARQALGAGLRQRAANQPTPQDMLRNAMSGAGMTGVDPELAVRGGHIPSQAAGTLPTRQPPVPLPQPRPAAANAPTSLAPPPASRVPTPAPSVNPATGQRTGAPQYPQSPIQQLLGNPVVQGLLRQLFPQWFMTAPGGPYAGRPLYQVPWMSPQQYQQYRRTGQFPERGFAPGFRREPSGEITYKGRPPDRYPGGPTNPPLWDPKTIRDADAEERRRGTSDIPKNPPKVIYGDDDKGRSPVDTKTHLEIDGERYGFDPAKSRYPQTYKGRIPRNVVMGSSRLREMQRRRGEKTLTGRIRNDEDYQDPQYRGPEQPVLNRPPPGRGTRWGYNQPFFRAGMGVLPHAMQYPNPDWGDRYAPTPEDQDLTYINNPDAYRGM